MALIPPEFIDEINRRLDIVDLVGSYVVLKKQGRNFLGLCPFHTENTPSFTVSPDKQIYHCFGCHEGGNGINFLMKIENLSFPEAVEKLADRLGLDLPKQNLTPEETERIRQRQSYFQLNNLARDFYQEYLWSKQGEQARAYFERRGLTPDIVKKFALGYAPASWDALLKFLLAKGYNHKQIEAAGLISLKSGMSSEVKAYDRFRGRVMFPILDFKGQVIAFGGRILEKAEGQAKYLNSPETAFFHKSQNLYGLFTAGNEIRKADEVVMMEGYMDVIAAHQYGITNAVASLGTAFTSDHASLIRRYSNNVLLAFDGDTAGVKAANKSMDVLYNLGCSLRVVHFPDDKDPDDFIREHGKVGWDDYVSGQALDFWGYKLKQGLRNHDVNTISGKTALMAELAPYMRACKNTVELDGFVALLAKTLGVSREAIYQDLRKPLGKGAQQAVNQAAGRSSEPAPQPQQPLNKREANLVLFMIYDRDIYEKTVATLGFDFTSHPVLQELLTLVQKIKEEYSWNPSSLFSYLEEGEARQLLLRMLSVTISPEDSHFRKLADGLINSFLIERKQREIEEKQESLKNLTELENSRELLNELIELQQEVRNLRNLD